MSIPLTVGKSRTTTFVLKNDDGTVNTTLTPTVNPGNASMRATINPSNNREIAVTGVSASGGANLTVTGVNNSNAQQVFVPTLPTGLASVSFGVWSDEIDPPSWA